MEDFVDGVHLDLVQGASFDLPITYQDDDENPINLTGYTARMQIRRTTGSVNPPVVDLSTENGSINVDGYNGGIDIFIPANITALFPAPFDGVWDLFLDGGNGIIDQFIRGTIRISERVTR